MDALKSSPPPIPIEAAADQAQPAADNTDPFANLAELRLDQSFIQSAGAKKLLTTVPVRKPNKQDWNRVHPGGDYRGNFGLIELKDEREVYFLHPSVAAAVANEAFWATLYTAINRQGVLFLWPVRLPPPEGEGKELEWNKSARKAAELATTRWMRIVANMSLGAYESYEATGSIPDPVWPEYTFNELLKVAFPRDRYVGSLNHPVLKKLRGE
jgi:hypothetical protein